LIRKSLNFIWVGNPALRPTTFIQSWAQCHPGWDLRVWDNEDLLGRNWVNAKHLRTMVQEQQWCGVADLMRWELLQELGGVFLDADSLCLRPLSDDLLENDAFACWENELERPGLIATGYLGACPGDPLIARIISDLSRIPSVSGQQAWSCVGPKRLTDTWRDLRYDRLTIYPSHHFIPRHYSGRVYHGSGAVYADQSWGSTYAGYATLETEGSGWQPGHGLPLPRITVGVPTRNQAHWLGEALDSALSQDYPDLEVLVVDDESEDDTPQLLASIRDPRLRVIRKSHTSLPDVRNLILEEATGDYICWLDSDDVLLPQVLSAYSERARDWPQVSVFYGDLLQIDAGGRPVGPLRYDNHAGNRHLLARLFQRNHMPNPGSFVRTAAMRAIGGFDPAAGGSCDYDLWMRLAARKEKFQHLGQTVLKYRWHGDNISFDPNIIRGTDLYLLQKMVETIPLDHLCSDLPWHDFPRACEEAAYRVGRLFQERGDLAKAAAWLAQSAMARSVTQLAPLPSGKDGELPHPAPKAGHPTPLIWISPDLDGPEFVNLHAIRAPRGPESREAAPDPDLTPEAISLGPIQPPLEPTPATPTREAFLYHPDWRGKAWVGVVMSYVTAFTPGEPIALILAWDPAAPSSITLEDAQDAVVKVLSLLKRDTVPDIVFVDRPEELLEVLESFDSVHWLGKTEAGDWNLNGRSGSRLSIAYNLLNQNN
jgi:glycosyltransferase involved in cell wall biosynthesis